MRNLKSGFVKFIAGRVGMYYSLFIISPLLFFGMFVFLAGTGYLWELCSEDSTQYFFVRFSINLFIILLIPIIATVGVVGSVVRTIASKDVGVIHKIAGVFFFLVVLFSWLMYLSLAIPNSLVPNQLYNPQASKYSSTTIPTQYPPGTPAEGR